MKRLFDRNDITQELALLTLTHDKASCTSAPTRHDAYTAVYNALRDTQTRAYRPRSETHDETYELPSCLTERQRTICECFMSGFTQSETAAVLGVSDRMIRKEIVKLGPVFAS